MVEMNKKYPQPSEFLQHVLQPSLKIEDKFAAYIVVALDGRVVTMEWPLVSVDICGPLENGLKELLGQDGDMIVRGATP